MKSLEDQIADKCIHFSGIMDKCCKMGVRYESVRFGKPYNFPCLKQGGFCALSQFKTKEEVDMDIEEMNKAITKTVGAYSDIKKHFEKTGERSGKIPCSCGGNLTFNVAKLNNHIWAKCSDCNVSFME